MTEEWRPVVGFEGRYDVSSAGRVRSLMWRGSPRKTPRVLRTALSDGYPHVSLSLGRDGCKATRKIHVLVAEAFIGPRPPGHECAHMDGTRTNNVPSNLAWVTSRVNNHHKTLHGTHGKGSRNHHAKLTEEAVIDIRRRAASGERHRTIAANYGVAEQTISWVLHRGWAHVDAFLKEGGKP